MDESEGTVTIRQAAVELEGKLIITTPKSKASRGTVKLLPFVVAMLEAQSAELQVPRSP
jgi:hypothetical protein